MFKLQKKAIRMVNLSKYNVHTDPIFKQLKTLKAQDILRIQQYKFYYKFTHNKLPACLQQLPLQPNHTIHNYNTQTYSDIHLNTIQQEFAKRCLRHSTPILVNRSSDLIKSKIDTHSLYGFIHYAKFYYLSKYQEQCVLRNWYICHQLQDNFYNSPGLHIINSPLLLLLSVHVYNFLLFVA